ncbi:hypothetical protein PLICRDRAFT_48370 [Plicaturopsis crispa FD-325 SS-3]|nr:hypothetical protein PLICRDRAFT_48370 [Plicaturopsis crispa FD-325 SS-3]
MPFTDPDASTTATSSSAPPPTHFPPPSNSRIVALSVTIGVVTALIILGGTYVYLRLRKKPAVTDTGDVDVVYPSGRASTLLDRTHPAARITPFGSPGGEIPRFSDAYVPGANMRVARRLEDGSWTFEDPQQSNWTTFGGNSESDLPPLSPSPSSQGYRSKEQEARMKTSSHGYLGADHIELVPPPAYSASVDGSSVSGDDRSEGHSHGS